MWQTEGAQQLLSVTHGSLLATQHTDAAQAGTDLLPACTLGTLFAISFHLSCFLHASIRQDQNAYIHVSAFSVIHRSSIETAWLSRDTL